MLFLLWSAVTRDGAVVIDDGRFILMTQFNEIY